MFLRSVRLQYDDTGQESVFQVFVLNRGSIIKDFEALKVGISNISYLSRLVINEV